VEDEATHRGNECVQARQALRRVSRTGRGTRPGDLCEALRSEPRSVRVERKCPVGDGKRWGSRPADCEQANQRFEKTRRTAQQRPWNAFAPRPRRRHPAFAFFSLWTAYRDASEAIAWPRNPRFGLVAVTCRANTCVQRSLTAGLRSSETSGCVSRAHKQVARSREPSPTFALAAQCDAGHLRSIAASCCTLLLPDPLPRDRQHALSQNLAHRASGHRWFIAPSR